MKILLTPLLLLLFSACASDGQAQQETVQTPKEREQYTYKPASRDGTGKFYLGREIAQVMGAAGSDWLDRPSRNTEENTDLGISHIKVASNAVIADIGAGTGYYSFRLARLVPQGKVIAVELQDELIALLHTRKKELGDTVVHPAKGTEKSTGLAANSVDLVIMVDVYHELAYPVEILRSIRQALRPGGRLLLIEYKGEDEAVRIKPLHKTTVRQLNKELGANGFTLAERGDFMPIQHFLLYEPATNP